jgi:hypothetical protein
MCSYLNFDQYKVKPGHFVNCNLKFSKTLTSNYFYSAYIHLIQKLESTVFVCLFSHFVTWLGYGQEECHFSGWSGQFRGWGAPPLLSTFSYIPKMFQMNLFSWEHVPIIILVSFRQPRVITLVLMGKGGTKT